MASKDRKSGPTAGAGKPAATRSAPPKKRSVSAKPASAKPLAAVAAKREAAVSAPMPRPAPAKAAPIKTAAPAEQAVASMPVPPVASAAAPQVSKETASMEDTVKKTAAKAQTLFAEMNDRAKTAMEKSSKVFEDINDFAKGNVEAMVESSKIAAKGFETIGQDAAEYGRKSFETATATMKQFAAVKSPTDFFKLQSDYVRSAFDSVVAETSKNTEAMLKLAGDVAQPLSNRAAVAAEKIKIGA